MQRRSQVSLVGGADRIPGGNKPQYLYIPVPIKCQGGQPRGAQIFPGGAEPPLAPPWLRAWGYAGVEFHDGNHGKCRDFFSLCRDALLNLASSDGSIMPYPFHLLPWCPPLSMSDFIYRQGFY